MKKLLKTFLIGTLCAIMMTALSCEQAKDAVDQASQFSYSGIQDTVLRLATPSVTVKAYPGYNLVSWQPVPDNKGYEVYRYENGYLTDKVIEKKTPGSNTFYEDTDVQNGVTYVYEVIALGSIAGRGVDTADSAPGSASCVGILPPPDTEPLDLAAYESGYTWGYEREIADGSYEDNIRLAPDNIDAAVDNEKTIKGLGRFVAHFQAKAYLDYAIVAEKGNEYDISNIFTATFGDKKSTVVNNSILAVSNMNSEGVGLATSGEYTVWVRVSAKSPYFVKRNYVKCSKKINIPELVTKEAPTITVSPAANKVTITVNALTYESGELVDPTYLHVYESVYNEKKFNPVNASFVKNSSSTGYENVDVPITKDGKKHEYMLVVTDGTKYCSKTASVTVQYPNP